MRALACGVLFAATVLTVAARAVPVPAPAAVDGPSEYQVKGAFIYNFMKFVEWPPAALTDPLVVGVVGSAPLADLEAALKDKSVRGRRIVVRAVENAGQPGPCHVLFISGDPPGQLRTALRAVAGAPVLTVSDVPDAEQPEAVINLVAVETRLAFQVNLELAQASGLQVSSKLLGLARTVRGHQGKTTP
jgi:hypothetical protein